MNPGPSGEQRRLAFSALYEEFQREVWSAAYARWLDPHLAMDITQEAFLRLWRQWESGESIDNPRAWLLRVARNLGEDYRKSAFFRAGTQAPHSMNGIATRSPLPLDLLAQDELFAEVRSVLRELSESDRYLLTLKYAWDFETWKIAELLGISESAVYMRLSRARKRLADHLAALKQNEES
jgi:RNA polymerase sigma-70 factor (ECF subfamily)